MSNEAIERLIAEFRQTFTPLITTDEAARIARTSVSTIHDWSSRNLLDGFKVKRGRRVLLDLAGFVRFLADHPTSQH